VAYDHNHDPSQSETDTIPGVAKRFKARNQPWALVVDENYGEGSAREHAALQPRFYGVYFYESLLNLTDTLRVLYDPRPVIRPDSRDQPQSERKHSLTELLLTRRCRNKASFLSGSRIRQITRVLALVMLSRPSVLFSFLAATRARRSRSKSRNGMARRLRSRRSTPCRATNSGGCVRDPRSTTFAHSCRYEYIPMHSNEPSILYPS
jgi:hypothetical protein